MIFLTYIILIKSKNCYFQQNYYNIMNNQIFAKQSQITIAKQNEAQDSEQKKVDQIVESEFAQKYRKYFNISTIPSSKDIYSLLLESNIFYLKQKWSKQLNYCCLDTDFQSLQLELHYGILATKITVFNFSMSLSLIDQMFISKGSFGKIYYLNIENENIVVKVIDRNLDLPIDQYLAKVYKEYMMFSIASSLKAGPKMVKPFGYDIVLVKNEAFFCMEACQALDSFDLSKKQEIQIQLKDSLKILHLLNFVHCDIKPHNLCWSPFFRKYVFIDFGLSEIIQQSIGEKTFTPFVGTYSFCSEEMKRCFILRTNKYIDLYYNDVCGLQQSFLQKEEQTCQHNKISSQIFFSYENPYGSTYSGQLSNQKSGTFLKDLSSILNIKFLLYNKQIHNAKSKIQKQQRMLKSCLMIINNYEFPKLMMESNQIAEKQKSLKQIVRNKILKNNFQLLKIDNLMCEHMSYLKTESAAIDSIPLDYIFNLDNQMFKKLLQKGIWIEKFYLTFIPLKNSFKTQIKMMQLNRGCMMILNKIYQIISIDQTNLYFKKNKLVLSFFHQKLTQNQNIKLLQSLINLFFASINVSSAMKTMSTVAGLMKKKQPSPLKIILKCLKYSMDLLYLTNFQQSFVCQNFFDIASQYREIKLFSSQIKQKCDILCRIIKLFRDLQTNSLTFSQTISNHQNIQKQILAFDKENTSFQYLQQIKTIKIGYQLMHTLFLVKNQSKISKRKQKIVKPNKKIYQLISRYKQLYSEYNLLSCSYVYFTQQSDIQLGAYLNQIETIDSQLVAQMFQYYASCTQSSALLMNQSIQNAFQLRARKDSNLFRIIMSIKLSFLQTDNKLDSTLDLILKKILNILKYVSLSQFIEQKQEARFQPIQNWKLIQQVMKKCMDKIMRSQIDRRQLYFQLIDNIFLIFNQMVEGRIDQVSLMDDINNVISKLNLILQMNEKNQIIYSILLIILSQIKKAFIFTNAQYIKELQQILLFLFYESDQSIENVNQIVIEEIMEINYSKLHFMKNYEIVLRIIFQIFISQQLDNDQCLYSMLDLSIDFFCLSTPIHFQILALMQITYQHQLLSLINFQNLNQIFYFVFCILQQCQHDLEMYQIQRILYVVACGMKNVSISNQSYIKTKYYTYFQKYVKIKSQRKYIYCIRNQIKYKSKLSHQKEHQLVKFIEKKFNEAKKNIQKSISKRITILLNT